MSLLFHQSVNMEQVISIGNYKKVGREPYFFNPQTNNLEGQFFLSEAPYRRLLQNVRCRLRRRCLYGEALGLQKPKPDCYYHQDNGFCPCSLEKNEDTKCMCKEFREMASGTCHCGLYTKTE